jgi:hypothetical protein
MRKYLWKFVITRTGTGIYPIGAETALWGRQLFQEAGAGARNFYFIVGSGSVGSKIMRLIANKARKTSPGSGF